VSLENKILLSEPSVNALLADNSTALLAGILSQERNNCNSLHLLTDFYLDT
jgi:hypothetical protein